MAIRTKTIEYAFVEDPTSVATAVARNFAQLAALAIPETTSRTFKSCVLQVSCWSNQATAASATAVLGGVALGAVGIGTTTTTFTLTNSGEDQAWYWNFDVTSYFVTNYTGTTMTADARLTVTGLATSNATAKLIITYEYDDAATTQIKTVRIPIEGNIGNLTTAFTTVGTTASQLPLLNTFLPEAGISIKSYWFQMDTHTGTTAAAASTLDMRYDGATTLSTLSNAFTQISDVACRWLNVLGPYGQALATNVARTIEAKVTSITASPFPCLSGVLYVTYTHTLSGISTTNGATGTGTTFNVVDGSVYPAAPFSIQVEDEVMRVTAIATNTLTVTRAQEGTANVTHATGLPVLPMILNSVAVTAIDESGWQGGTTTADTSRFTRDISVQEPGNIILKQSAVMQSLNDAGAISTDLRVGSQASRVFVHPASLHCGGMTHMRRVDSLAIGGVGLTLTRGFNTIVLDYFSTSATAGNIGSNTSGILFLNYYSGQATLGPGGHNHTTKWCIRPYQTGGAVQRLQAAASKTPSIQSTVYWLVGVSYELILQTITTAPAQTGLAFNCKVQSGEAEGAGWRALYSSLFISDVEIGQSFAWARGRTEFKRYPTDLDSSRLDIETARDYRFDTAQTGVMVWQADLLLTYHTISYTIAGNITNSLGGTVTLYAYRADTGERIGTTSRSGNGAYSIPWYDNTVDVFVEAFEDGTHLGRSANGKAA